MFNKISFVGGIHGVGKSTICQHICHELHIEYLSASKLLQWEKINGDSKAKNVKNILNTQNQLIAALKRNVQREKSYLLDGHYCLLDNNNKVVNIPLDTFRQIKPNSFILILGEIKEIKHRLDLRDGKLYSYELLEHLQDSELSYAKYLSEALDIPLIVGNNSDYSNILNSLCKITKTTY